MRNIGNQFHRLSLAMIVAISTMSAGIAAAEDIIELLSGNVVRGEVSARTETDVTVKSTISGRSIVRKFPIDRVHAVTVGGNRTIINEKKNASTPAKPSVAGQPIDSENRKTRAQVLAEIDQAGKTQPSWLVDTPLVFPNTLDLSWPQPPPTKGWQPQVNMGAYIWDVINPNPGRWPQGIKLLLHVLEVNQGNAEVTERVQLAIAKIYYSHLNDFARAAYWYRTVGAEDTDRFGESAVALAECYYHLGNKQMAVALLRRVSERNSAIKAWTTLGEIDEALAIAKRLLKDGADSHTMMYAGDAQRIAGRYDDAIAYYQQVLDLGASGSDKRLKKNQGRAQASIDAIRLFEKSDVARVPDGTYTAQSLGYEAQVVVEVTVANKRIAGVRVVKHSEKQFYSSLVDTPARIIAKQSVKGVDTTSDATLTSEAIINATAKALAGAAN